jgi:hypothetical protein
MALEVATTIGGQRKGSRHRPMLKAVRSGVVLEKDGTRHEIVAGRDVWHPQMLSRIEPRYADFFTAIDAVEEYRSARRSRRSRRSTRRPRERVWKLP